MTDLMNKYLKGCSPYISSLIYDIDSRQLLLECVNNPDECKPLKKIIFREIESYSEETMDDEYDDNCIDGVIGMSWIGKNKFCIHTDKKRNYNRINWNYRG